MASFFEGTDLSCHRFFIIRFIKDVKRATSKPWTNVNGNSHLFNRFKIKESCSWQDISQSKYILDFGYETSMLGYWLRQTPNSILGWEVSWISPCASSRRMLKS